jgi:hypothetical protein
VAVLRGEVVGRAVDDGGKTVKTVVNVIENGRLDADADKMAITPAEGELVVGNRFERQATPK